MTKAQNRGAVTAAAALRSAPDAGPSAHTTTPRHDPRPATTAGDLVAAYPAQCRDERLRVQVRQAGTSMRAVFAYVCATSLIFVPGAGSARYVAWAAVVMLAQWLRQRYAERLIDRKAALDERDEWRLGVAMLAGDAPVYLAAPIFVAALEFEARMYYTVLHFGLVVGSAYFVGLNPRIFPWYVLMGLGILMTGGWLFPSLPNVLITLVTHTAIAIFLILFSIRISRTFDASVAMRLEREQLVARLTAALDDAAQAQRSRSRLLAAASHDLLQPVHTLVLLMDLVRDDSTSADARAATVARMHQASRSIDSMFRSLLDLARLDAGALHAALRPIDVGPLLDTVCAPYDIVARDTDLRLSWGSSAGLRVKADPVLLERCLRNVLDNAVKYSHRGGDVRVRAWPGKSDGLVVFEVRDSGPGIPQAERERVFDDFFRGEGAGATAGVGLGLSITRQLLGLMQGRIELESAGGQGTTVRMVVPGAGAKHPQVGTAMS